MPSFTLPTIALQTTTTDDSQQNNTGLLGGRVIMPVCMLCSALNVCSVELLLKIGTLLIEMLGYEKTLDSLIDLLRRDEVRL